MKLDMRESVLCSLLPKIMEKILEKMFVDSVGIFVKVYSVPSTVSLTVMLKPFPFDMVPVKLVELSSTVIVISLLTVTVSAQSARRTIISQSFAALTASLSEA